MVNSRFNKKQTSNMFEKGLSCNKISRKPLKCKKNVIHISGSRKNSLKNFKSEEKNINLEIDQNSLLKSEKKILRTSPRLSLSQGEIISVPEKHTPKFLDPYFKVIDSFEIDVLGNFTQSFTISSCSKQNNKIQFAKEKNTRENISKLKSERRLKNLHKLSDDVSPFLQNKFPLKNKRQSFYRQSSLISQHGKYPSRKVSLNDMDIKMATPRTSDSQRLRISMVLRSAPKDKRTSNDKFLSDGLGTKRIKKSITTPKNQQTVITKEIKSLPSKASVQRRKGIDSVLSHIENPETVYKLPEAIELFTNTHSARSSMTLRSRHSLEMTEGKKNKEIDSVSRSIQKPKTDINHKAQKAVQLSLNLPRSSMTLRTRHSSEKTIKNKTPLHTRHFSEKIVKDPLSEMLHIANRDKVKRKNAISNKQKKENVKNRTRSKSTSLADQETEILLPKHKINCSSSRSNQKSKNNIFNDKDSQMQKMTPATSAKIARSSQRKSLTLGSRSNLEKTSNGDLKIRECSIILSDSIKEAPVKKSTISSKKKMAEVEGKKNARKRLPSSPLKAKTPTQKKRKLSVTFKKQACPRSYSAIIPIDSLSLGVTPPLERKTKSEGYKFPGKNTLKRKRYVINEIKKADDGYEDDIYESKTFDHFKDIFPDSSDSSEISFLLKTPKLASVPTPNMHCKTPGYRDCFSPTEYALNRKIAEECFYRNRKMKKRKSQIETPEMPEKQRLEFDKVVEKACAVQKEVEKLTADSSDEEDLYFTDDF